MPRRGRAGRPRDAAFWDDLGVEPDARAAGRCAAPRRRSAVGGCPRSRCARRSRDLGSRPWRPPTGEVCGRGHARLPPPELGAINEQALAGGRAVDAGEADRHAVWVGPLIPPGGRQAAGSASPRGCARTGRSSTTRLDARTGGARARARAAALESSDRAGGRAWPPRSWRARWSGTPRQSLQGRLMTFDLVWRELAFHTLVQAAAVPRLRDEPAVAQPPGAADRARPRPSARPAEVARSGAAAADTLRAATGTTSARSPAS